MVSTVRRLASSNRLSWLLWMTFGTLLLIPLVLLDVLMEVAREMHALWHWRYKADLQTFIGYFSERHRLSLKSIGMKPQP